MSAVSGGWSSSRSHDAAKWLLNSAVGNAVYAKAVAMGAALDGAGLASLFKHVGAFRFKGADFDALAAAVKA